MLLFYCARETDLTQIHKSGVQKRDRANVILWKTLDRATKTCSDVILVVDAKHLPFLEADPGTPYEAVNSLPPEAFCNLEPFLPVHLVVAGGGYLIRRQPDTEPEILMIFRRGVWDLPKGKQDAEETIEACALREVREEIGIHELYLQSALGTTVHGYRQNDCYCIKTTYWFKMNTPERVFAPQIQEGIEAVAWFSWMEAKQRIGFETIRRHMGQVEHVILSV